MHLKSPWKVLEKGMSWSVGTMVTYLRSTTWRQSTTCLWPFWSSLFSVFSDLFEINHVKTIYHMFVAILIVFSVFSDLFEINHVKTIYHMFVAILIVFVFCFQWPIWDQPHEDNLPHVCGHSDRFCFLFSVTYLRSTMWRQSTTCLWPFWPSFLFSVTYLRSTMWRQSTTCLWPFWPSFLFSVTYLRSIMWRQSTTCLWSILIVFSVFSDLFEINHVKTIYHMFVAILIVFSVFSDLFEINHVKTIYHMFVAILIVFVFCFQWPIWDQPSEDNLPHVCGHSDRLCFLFSVTYLRSTMWRQSTTCLWPFWSSFLFSVTRVPTVLEKSLNFGFSLKSPWKWICPWKVLEFRGPSLKFQLVVLDFLFCVFWTESLNAYSKLRGTRANFPPKKFGSLRSQQFTS